MCWSASLDQEEKDQCDSILNKYANVLPGAGSYNSMDEAAIASMISTYFTNPRNRIEYSALIYPTNSSLENFNYIEPQTQNLKNNTDPLIPDEAHSIYHRIENGRLDVPGARELNLLSYELGWSHNHPYDGTEYFSRYDILVSNDRAMTGYLLTPDLDMIKYQPAEDQRQDPRRGVPIEGAPTAEELELLKDCLLKKGSK